MADHLSPERRSENMRAVRGKDTKPELLVRSLLHRAGYRFRLRPKDLPGKPDIVFRGRRKAIFVHGCFWHGHDCKRGTRPSNNATFWAQKLDRNRVRDAAQVAALEALGWSVFMVWECGLKDHDHLLAQLKTFLGSTEAPASVSHNTVA